MTFMLQIQGVHHLDYIWVRVLFSGPFFSHFCLVTEYKQQIQMIRFHFLCLLQSSPVSRRGLECPALERTVSKSALLSLSTPLKDYQLQSDS